MTKMSKVKKLPKQTCKWQWVRLYKLSQTDINRHGLYYYYTEIDLLQQHKGQEEKVIRKSTAMDFL